MRGDIVVREVLSRCDALKGAGLWPSEPTLRPRAWLENFEKEDKPLAALLLERFNFFNERLTVRLLCAAYNSLGDGLPKGPKAPNHAALQYALRDAVFTPVEGEHPNRSDSGNLVIRLARQVVGIPAERVKDPIEALECAAAGRSVIFVDDFIGSGDQFLNTWRRPYSKSFPSSFQEAFAVKPFTAMYVCLIATDYGLQQLHGVLPQLAVCTAHVLDETCTVRDVKASYYHPEPGLQEKIAQLLRRYAPRLIPREDYMAAAEYKEWGYKRRGLLFAFAHSVPDATLPIFWAPGTGQWLPLLERK